ncbi:MAG: insulinase family protein [Verrucomicrobia bacterium]|nr:insulinase family protein [Verrucomicrobiota bacterium]
MPRRVPRLAGIPKVFWRGVLRSKFTKPKTTSLVAGEALNALLWPEQALGRPIAGTIASVGGIPRKGLMGYWERRIRGVRPVLAIAGGMSLEEVRKTAKAALRRSSSTASGEPIPARRVRSSTVRVVAVAKPVAQVNVTIGIYAFRRQDPRRHGLRMLSVILGEAMSSRLFQRLREEQGLVYSVSSGVHLQRDDGAFYISAGLEPGNLSKALGLIAAELKSLAAKGPGAAELKRAKDYVTGQFALGLEGTSQQMFWIGDSMLTRGRVVEPKEAIEKLAAVDAKIVKEVAQELFQPGRMGVAASGPEMDAAKLAAAAQSLG